MAGAQDEFLAKFHWQSETVSLFQGLSEAQSGRLGMSYFHARSAPSAGKLRNRSGFVAGAVFLPVGVQIHSPRPFL
jgi:hypothetical protein